MQNALVTCIEKKYELMAVDRYVWPNQTRKKKNQSSVNYQQYWEKKLNMFQIRGAHPICSIS